MQIRRPIVAHQFYPGQRKDCVAQIEQCLSEGHLPAVLPDKIVAGIVPRAGWVFSGDLAGLVFASLRRQYDHIEVFVIQWAAQVNDRRFIDLALAMEPEQMLAEAAENVNACGPGAAAAAVAAAKAFGKTEGQLLAYTNSHRVMADKMDTFSLDSVGYAAIVF